MRRFSKNIYASMMTVALATYGICACSDKTEETEETVIESIASSTTESVSESQSSQQTSSQATVTTTEPTSQTIRETVYTDDEISVITHPEVLDNQSNNNGIQSVYNRPTEEYMDTVHLEYADGMIFPYMSYGSMVEDDYYGYYPKSYWGLVDEHGTIISDGIYNSVFMPINKTFSYSSSWTYECYPFWVANNYSDGYFQYDIISVDGSVYIDGDFSSVDFYDDAFVTDVINGDTHSVSKYDFDGNLVGGPVSCVPRIRQSSRHLMYADCLTAKWLFDDGNILYQLAGSEGEEYSEYFITDTQGNQVSEMYNEVLGCNGRAVAVKEFDSNLCGVMDSAGSLLIDTIYEDIKVLPNGNFLCIDGSTYKIFGIDYLYKTSFDAYKVVVTDDRMMAFIDSGSRLKVYDFEGQCQESYGPRPLGNYPHWLVKKNYEEDTWICINVLDAYSSSNTVKVYNPYIDKVISGTSVDLIGETVVTANRNRTILYDTNLNEIKTINKSTGREFYTDFSTGWNYIVYTGDYYDPERVIYSPTTGDYLGEVEIIGRPRDFGASEVYILNGVVYCEDSHGSILYNLSEGETVFRYEPGSFIVEG